MGKAKGMSRTVYYVEETDGRADYILGHNVGQLAMAHKDMVTAVGKLADNVGRAADAIQDKGMSEALDRMHEMARRLEALEGPAE